MTTRNPNTFQAIKGYFLKTFFNEPTRQQDIPVDLSASRSKLQRKVITRSKQNLFGRLKPSTIFQHLMNKGIGKTKVPGGPYSLALTSSQDGTHSKDYSDDTFKNHQEDIYSEDYKDFPDQNDLP